MLALTKYFVNVAHLHLFVVSCRAVACGFTVYDCWGAIQNKWKHVYTMHYGNIGLNVCYCKQKCVRSAYGFIILFFRYYIYQCITVFVHFIHCHEGLTVRLQLQQLYQKAKLIEKILLGLVVGQSNVLLMVKPQVNVGNLGMILLYTARLAHIGGIAATGIQV